MTKKLRTLWLTGCLLIGFTTTAWPFGGGNCREVNGVPKCSWLLPGHAVPPLQLYASRATLQADLRRANLVSAAQERLLKTLGASGSIQLTNSDFTAFAQPGKTQLTYVASSESVAFEMVIGPPDLVNSQIWTLPADLTTELDVAQRRDFINPSTIPAGLQLAGVTHASKFVAPNRLFTGYRQYQISGSAVNFLGGSVDRKVGIDFSTASPNALFSVLPLQAGSAYTSQVVYDDPDDDVQEIETDTLSFDGFGSLKTPNGTVQALRYTIKSGLRTYDLSGGGPPSNSNLIDLNTTTQVGWVTKEGYWILADYADYNPTTHAATLSNVQYTTIVPTNSLSPTFTNTCNCSR
jgi:hypothetical protein